MYKHIAGSHTQTQRCTASPSCWTALRRYSLSFTAPRWLELHCFSSWRSRARIVFTLTSRSASWLSSVVKTSHASQRLRIFYFVCWHVCPVCVCVFWDASLFCFNGERWHHSVQWPSLQAFPRGCFTLTLTGSAPASHQRLRLSWTLLICPHTFGTFSSCLTCGVSGF